MGTRVIRRKIARKSPATIDGTASSVEPNPNNSGESVADSGSTVSGLSVGDIIASEPESGEYTDPGRIGSGSYSGTDSDNGTGKRRGRPRGSKNGNKGGSQTSQNLEAILFSLHAMGSSFFNVPELELTEDEARKLAQATQRVSDLYEVSVIPEKTMAWIQLSIIAAGIYGPRYMMIQSRKKETRKGPRAVPMHTTVGPQFNAQPATPATGFNAVSLS